MAKRCFRLPQTTRREYGRCQERGKQSSFRILAMGLNKLPGKQGGARGKETSGLTGLEKEGKPAAPIGVLYIYGAPTVYRALS